jgi:hypothetical protein
VIIKSLYLLTMKPLIYVANVGESDLGDKGAGNKYVQVGGWVPPGVGVHGVWREGVCAGEPLLRGLWWPGRG